MAVEISARKEAEQAGATLAEWLRARLAEEIVRGDISGKLDEEDLAERFRVSRTPVREALKQLHSLGLVEHRPNRGATVIAIPLFELFEAYGAVMASCAELAWSRLDAAGRRNLIEAPDDTVAMAILLAGLRNAALSMLVTGLASRVRLIMPQPLPLREALAGARSARRAGEAIAAAISAAYRELAGPN